MSIGPRKTKANIRMNAYHYHLNRRKILSHYIIRCLKDMQKRLKVLGTLSSNFMMNILFVPPCLQGLDCNADGAVYVLNILDGN